MVNAPAADVVAELKSTGEGDILVNTSASVSKPLLAADLRRPAVPDDHPRDRRRRAAPLRRRPAPARRWTLTHQETGELGEMALVYDRMR